MRKKYYKLVKAEYGSLWSAIMQGKEWDTEGSSDKTLRQAFSVEYKKGVWAVPRYLNMPLYVFSSLGGVKSFVRGNFGSHDRVEVWECEIGAKMKPRILHFGRIFESLKLISENKKKKNGVLNGIPEEIMRTIPVCTVGTNRVKLTKKLYSV